MNFFSGRAHYRRRLHSSVTASFQIAQIIVFLWKDFFSTRHTYAKLPRSMLNEIFSNMDHVRPATKLAPIIRTLTLFSSWSIYTFEIITIAFTPSLTVTIG